jgi:hypothetical protein
MNQRGPVYVNGQYVQDTIIDWVFAMGYPLTEPYWIPIQVGNEQRWVLMQAFQRRILTYTPGNPQGFQVEMGNVGRTYYDWRYGQTPPAPTPTPQPTVPAGQPGITVSPNQGDATTTIQVNGANFPRNAQVVLQVERADAGYTAGITTVTTNNSGAFTANFRLPAQATRYESVTIAAIANAGAVRVTSNYKLNYQPRIDINPKGAILNGAGMNVSGSGYPANVNVQIGILFDGQSNAEYPTSTRTDVNGTFQASFGIGTRAAGTRFIVFATSEGGVKATYTDRVTVYNRPNLQVNPGSGPVGVNVVLQGTGWPVGQQIAVGYKGINDPSEAFLPNLITVDGNGNFSVPIFLDGSFAGKGQVRFSASAGALGIRVETLYTIVGPAPTPVPAQPILNVSPGAVQVGQNVSLSGSGWTPGTQVTIALAIPGSQQDVASVNVNNNGAFGASFTLGTNWANRGTVQVIARSNNGRTATSFLTVIPSGGTNNLEYGLGMSVQTYSGVGGPYVKVTGQGWQPGLSLTISVVSAGGDLNTGVANAVVRDNGTWQASFNNSGSWIGRSDIGVRASNSSGSAASGRRLPVAGLTKVNGGTYTLSGSNWGPGSRVNAVLLVDGNEQDGLGNANVDVNGNFVFNIVVPRANGERSVRVTSSGGNGILYEAVFGLDASGALINEPVIGLTAPAAGAPIDASAPELSSRKAAPSVAVGMPNTGESDNALIWWASGAASLMLASAGLLLVRQSRSANKQ